MALLHSTLLYIILLSLYTSSTYITTTHLLWVDDRPAEITQLAEQLGVLGTRVSRVHYRRKDALWWVCWQYHLPRWALQSVTSMERIPWTPSWQLSPQCEEIEGIARTTETWPKNFEGVRPHDSRTPSKEVIDPVSPDEKTTNQVHYLPHHSVVHSDKVTTKLHVVIYDTSSKTSSPSFNSDPTKSPLLPI